MADWKDILSEPDKQLSEEELLKYFDENTDEQERTFLEEKINSSEFDADAVNGLSQLKNKENIQKNVQQLKQQLQQLTAKKQRKQKRSVVMFEWIILAIVLLLLICVIGYFVINLQNKSQIHSQVIMVGKFFV